MLRQGVGRSRASTKNGTMHYIADVAPNMKIENRTALNF